MVVFPEPLSPTSPKVSPRLMEKLMSSTALTWATVRLKISPSVIGKCILRFLTSKSTLPWPLAAYLGPAYLKFDSYLISLSCFPDAQCRS